MKEHGIPHTSVREGIYTDAFPLFLSWYPDSSEVILPTDGPVAWASRDELGEATATLMLRDPPPQFHDTIALLTGPRAYTMTEIAEAISEATGREIKVTRIDREEFSKTMAEYDSKEGRGEKPDFVFDKWLTMLETIGKGEAATVDPLMGELLGRKPRDGREFVKELIQSAGPEGYTWHQNYFNRG